MRSASSRASAASPPPPSSRPANATPIKDFDVRIAIGELHLASDLHRLARQHAGAIELIDIDQQPRDGVHHFHSNRRRVRELVKYPVARGDQQLVHAHVAGLERIGLQARVLFEQGRQERLYCSRLSDLFLGDACLLCRDVSLPRRGHDACNQRECAQRCRRHGISVTAHELAGAITERVAPRAHRHAVEIVAQIFGELIDARVTPLRLLAQSHQQHVVEIPLQRAPNSFAGELHLRCRVASGRADASFVDGRARFAQRRIAENLDRPLGRPLSSRYGLRPVNSRYNTTPNEYTSLAVVMGSPRTCSGLAYSSVITRT